MAAAKTGTQDAAKAKTTGKPAGRSAGRTGGFSADERAAMKERSEELKAESRRRGKRDERAEGESAALAAIAAMGPDRALAERLHALIKAAAPELWAKTWYGMPAYVKDGKTICFFQNAGKFKARYSTLGFNDSARLDDGNMWPTYYALKQLTPAEEAKITALVKQAVS